MSETQGPGSIRVGTTSEQRFAKFILAQSWEIAVAMVRLRMSPPTTDGRGADQGRFPQVALLRN